MRIASRLLLSSLILLVGTGGVFAQKNLQKADKKAKEMLDKDEAMSLVRHKKLERLRKDLRYISEELDREIVVDPREKDHPWEYNEKGLEEFSRGGLFRLGNLRKHGNIDPALGPALDLLEGIFADLPKRTYAEQYSRGLFRSITRELRWIAEEAKGREDLLALLKSNLVLPDTMPTDAEEAKKKFPVNLPLEEFKKLGPIKIFIVKHRTTQPKKYVKTSWEPIVDNKHNVQIGVEISGTVNRHSKSLDKDYTFDIGNIHIELTPEWRMLHPKIKKPVTGQKIRVKGWSYFDVFHKAEEEYDPEDPVYGRGRWTQWEIHPVMQIEILP